MNFQRVLEFAVDKAPLPALARDLRAVAHKLRYPLADILAKVPGDTLAERRARSACHARRCTSGRRSGSGPDPAKPRS